MEKMKTLTIKGIKYEIVDEVARDNNVPPINLETDNGKILTVVDGEASWEATSDNFLPVPTAEDNGKMLQVVDGQPVWVAITNGNEVAY